MSPRPLLVGVLPVALLIASLAGAARAQEMPPAPIVTATVLRQDVAPRRTFVGTVRPSRTSVVGSEVSGRVDELLAVEGARVAKGAPLARVRSARVAADLAAAKAVLAERQERLRGLKNGSRPEDVSVAEEREASAAANLEYAQWQEETGRKLRESGAINESEYRARRLALTAAERARSVVRLELALLRLGPREEEIAAVSAEVDEQSAVVARIQDDLDRHTISAPFHGYVTAKHTEVGEWLVPGAMVATVAALDEVDVRVGVVEDAIAAVSVGDTAFVEVPALAGRTIEGRVHVVIPLADDRTRSFPVDVRIRRSGDNEALAAGMFARVSLAVGSPRSALVIPKDALVLGGASPMVYVVVPGEGGALVVQPVPVQTGDALDGLISVTGPLEEGATIVVRGNERLRPGQKVMPLPPDGGGGAGPKHQGD